MPTTIQLLQKAHGMLDELDHRLTAAEKREARLRREAMQRADAASYEKSREHMLDQQAKAREYQARAQDALDPWGINAPAIVAGESLGRYRRRLDALVQKQLPEDHELYGVPLAELDPAALLVIEDQLYPAVKDAAYRPDSVPSDKMRRVMEVDSNGLKMVKWIGQRSFIHDFARPGRRGRIRNPSTEPSWFIPR
jgi:hypothetical protein